MRNLYVSGQVRDAILRNLKKKDGGMSKQALKPRDYQIKAVQDARDALRQGYKNIAIFCCGGSGKSLIAKMILEMASHKGKKIAFFSHRKILIEQIKKYNIPNCTVGTIQKHCKNGKSEHFDLAIIDESYGEYGKMRSNLDATYTITLSGTPTTPDGYALDYYDYIVNGIQFHELVNLGLAKPLKILAIPSVDTANLKIQNGDYAQDDAYRLMSKAKVVENIIDTYNRHATDRKTMLFAINTMHAEELKDEFVRAGIKADTVHSKKSNMEEVLQQFDSGEIKVLISVSKLNIGYDNVSVNCIMLARPTKSIPLMFQTIWRGTRLNPQSPNDNCLILDLCGVFNDTQHPMMPIDIYRKKTDANTKKCNCGESFKLADRKIVELNEYEYKVVSNYICICGNTERVEKLKVVNITPCENCNQPFKSIGGLKLEKNEDGIKFTLTCQACGAQREFRSIEYTKAELQELTIQDALRNMDSSWEALRNVLKSECKKCNFKWQYADRIIDHFKIRGISIGEASGMLKRVIKNGQKVSRLMYV